jgi:acyl-CoA thioester hydrolase
MRKNATGADPQLLAEGETVHVVCDEKFNRQPLPEQYAAALRSLMN